MLSEVNPAEAHVPARGFLPSQEHTGLPLASPTGAEQGTVSYSRFSQRSAALSGESHRNTEH